MGKLASSPVERGHLARTTPRLGGCGRDARAPHRVPLTIAESTQWGLPLTKAGSTNNKPRCCTFMSDNR